MGKHVPSGNRFRPYELVDQLDNAYFCQPNAYIYLPTD